MCAERWRVTTRFGAPHPSRCVLCACVRACVRVRACMCTFVRWTLMRGVPSVTYDAFHWSRRKALDSVAIHRAGLSSSEFVFFSFLFSLVCRRLRYVICVPVGCVLLRVYVICVPVGCVLLRVFVRVGGVNRTRNISCPS